MSAGAKLSKSLHGSQVPDLSLDRFEPEFQHLAVCWSTRGGQLGLSLGQCQFQPGLAGLAVVFFRRQGWAQRLYALRLFLLGLDRFAFEPARHGADRSRNRAVPFADAQSAVQYVDCARNSLHQWPLAWPLSIGNSTALLGWRMDKLIRDLRHAGRMLRKTPVFTSVVVFTLAVGIGANTAMFSVVNGVLLQGLPFPHPERIVDLNEVERRNIAGGGAIAPATFIDWRKMATSYDVMSVFSPRTYNVTPDTGEPARVRGTIASSSFFAVLGVSPILGRGFTPGDAQPGQGQSVVLSFGFWQRQFAGKPDVLNQSVRLNGQPYTIIGVMPATLNFPDATNFWVPSTHDVPSCGGPP